MKVTIIKIKTIIISKTITLSSCLGTTSLSKSWFPNLRNINIFDEAQEKMTWDI